MSAAVGPTKDMEQVRPPAPPRDCKRASSDERTNGGGGEEGGVEPHVLPGPPSSAKRRTMLGPTSSYSALVWQ